MVKPGVTPPPEKGGGKGGETAIPKAVSKYMSALGRKGGSKSRGTEAAKRRSEKAVAARQAKRAERKKAEGI